MKKLSLLIAAIFVAITAQAGIQVFNSSNANLGVFAKAKCGTGVTCTKGANSVLSIVSSPSLVGPLTLERGAILANPSSYDVSIASSADTSLSIIGGEGYAAILKLKADEADDAADTFSIQASGDNTLKVYAGSTLLLNASATQISGDGSIALAGYTRPIVQGSARSILKSECGTIFRNAGAIQMDLPEASTVLGCSYTFTTANASNFDVNPADGTDYIQGLTNAAGDMIRNATVGNSVTLTAISADLWVATAIYGTWSDAN